MKRIVFYLAVATTSLAMGFPNDVEQSELPPILTPLMKCSLANEGPARRFDLFTAFDPHAFNAKGPGVVLVDQPDPFSGLSREAVYTDVNVKTALLDCGGPGLGVQAHYRLSGIEGNLRATFCSNPNKLPEGSWEVAGTSPIPLRCKLSK